MTDKDCSITDGAMTDSATTDNIVDFDTAKPPHDFARKERKLQDIRKRLNAGLEKTAKKKTKKKRKKKR